jgi:nucleoside-diphosphate-sugar epimerase
MSKVAITGASGYVGSAIARAFRGQGWEVLELGRQSSPRFALGEEVVVDWTGVDALVHCAWAFDVKGWEQAERINVHGSLRLLETGPRRGVFISSLSCFEGCKSLYGKGKLEVESEALKLGYAVVRPGLVYGGEAGGMMGSLENAVKASPLVPLIGDGSYPQYPVHEDDLAELVFRLCEMPDPPGGPIAAASGEAIPFKQLLARVAARHGRQPAFVPVPWRMIWAGLKTFEALGLKPPFRSDSLVGFVFQNPAPDFSAAHAVSTFRPFQ